MCFLQFFIAVGEVRCPTSVPRYAFFDVKRCKFRCLLKLMLNHEEVARNKVLRRRSWKPVVESEREVNIKLKRGHSGWRLSALQQVVTVCWSRARQVASPKRLHTNGTFPPLSLDKRCPRRNRRLTTDLRSC